MLKMCINGILRGKGKMYQYFLRRKVFEDRKQTKGENRLITGDAIALNLIRARYILV